MRRKPITGRNPSPAELREAERIASLHPEQQRAHPSALAADHAKLEHINTCGALPEYYIDRPFSCRQCGKHEIWTARAQKWYYEEAKGHVDAYAVECHDCRKRRKQGNRHRG
ncbi:MAG: zinc-ribbon domain containing protein [Woeseiaceae bacterium]|nr:zinc-ribbon domain containing protein [Woeseiaceae bacterium]